MSSLFLTFLVCGGRFLRKKEVSIPRNNTKTPAPRIKSADPCVHIQARKQASINGVIATIFRHILSKDLSPIFITKNLSVFLYTFLILCSSRCFYEPTLSTKQHGEARYIELALLREIFSELPRLSLFFFLREKCFVFCAIENITLTSSGSRKHMLISHFRSY